MPEFNRYVVMPQHHQKDCRPWVSRGWLRANLRMHGETRIIHIIIYIYIEPSPTERERESCLIIVFECKLYVYNYHHIDLILYWHLRSCVFFGFILVGWTSAFCCMPGRRAQIAREGLQAYELSHKGCPRPQRLPVSWQREKKTVGFFQWFFKGLRKKDV